MCVPSMFVVTVSGVMSVRIQAVCSDRVQLMCVPVMFDVTEPVDRVPIIAPYLSSKRWGI